MPKENCYYFEYCYMAMYILLWNFVIFRCNARAKYLVQYKKESSGFSVRAFAWLMHVVVIPTLHGQRLYFRPLLRIACFAASVPFTHLPTFFFLLRRGIRLYRRRPNKTLATKFECVRHNLITARCVWIDVWLIFLLSLWIRTETSYIINLRQVPKKVLLPDHLFYSKYLLKI
jgi:hypothetical protein